MCVCSVTIIYMKSSVVHCHAIIPRITSQYHTPTNAHAHKINRHSYFIFSEMAESEARFASASDEDIATLLR